MGERVAKIDERVGGRRRRVERAIIMHGTSPYRAEAARLLARLLDVSGASAIAYGWTDGLAPTLLAPVHVIATRPDVEWDAALPASHTEPIDRSPPFEWKLLLRGALPGTAERLASSIGYAKGYLADAASRDVPVADLTSGSVGRFLGLLDAFRFCGFRLAPKYRRSVQHSFREAIPSLPPAGAELAGEMVEALDDPGELQGVLLRLGMALDLAGRLEDAVIVHLIGYELALQRCDGIAGIDAARSAGRAFRRKGELGASIRWYELAARLAEFEEDWGRLALALDGAGNTYRHRGSFPDARKAYRSAWRYASLSKDPAAIGNVATSMMTVEREAGHLASAATYGWTALKHRRDPEARARALINLGTLLREGRDLENAALAFRVARRETRDSAYRALATDGMAFCAALDADRARYGRLRRQVVEARVREPFLRAQIGYFRALSLAALGEPERGRRVLGAVERYARKWKLAEWEVKAAELVLPLPHSAPMDTPAEVRQGLQALQTASA